MSDFKTIVVPYDFSPHARAALDVAVDLARKLAADLHLVHVTQPPTWAYGVGTHAGAVVPPPVDMREVNEGALKSLREVASSLADPPGALESHVIEGAGIPTMLCDIAERLGADLIVMGTHGRTGLAHAFLGSVAERTLRAAACPVLTVRGTEDSQADS